MQGRFAGGAYGTSMLEDLMLACVRKTKFVRYKDRETYIV